VGGEEYVHFGWAADSNREGYFLEQYFPAPYRTEMALLRAQIIDDSATRISATRVFGNYRTINGQYR